MATREEMGKALYEIARGALGDTPEWEKMPQNLRDAHCTIAVIFAAWVREQYPERE